MLHWDKNQTEAKQDQNLNFFNNPTSTGLVRLYSRSLDNMTDMFPEVTEAIRCLPCTSAIIDSEAIAIDRKTGRLLPFQETVQRKRKHGIEAKAKEIPLVVFAFDLLYLDSQNLISQPFSVRRQKLEKLLSLNNPTIRLTEQRAVSKPEAFEIFFEEVKNEGLEGLMAKKASAPYQAGIRNHNWVKYKVGMRSDLADTIDCVVMGYYKGQGKRTKFGLGAFLVGIPRKKEDNLEYVTVSKIGTGLSDDQWRQLFSIIKTNQLKTKDKPANYNVAQTLHPDVWLVPKLVVEIEADTITKSPLHTAGLALRFPRLKRFREDKPATEATNLTELTKMRKT
jgi:DNA ligase-1